MRRWLYPAHCALCDAILTGREKGLCSACRQNIHFTRCPFEKGFAAFPYRGVYRDAVRRFKYSGRAEYAAFFAEAVVRAAFLAVQDFGQSSRETSQKISQKMTQKGHPKMSQSQFDLWRPDVLVPVPVHGSRFRERGYNQAEELARELSRILQIPCDTGLVFRTRNTQPQNGLSPEQRKENVKQAFAVKKHALIPRRVLLVDDIYTTGSTRNELENLLYRCGVQKVYMVCICLASPQEHTQKGIGPLLSMPPADRRRSQRNDAMHRPRRDKNAEAFLK